MTEIAQSAAPQNSTTEEKAPGNPLGGAKAKQAEEKLTPAEANRKVFEERIVRGLKDISANAQVGATAFDGAVKGNAVRAKQLVEDGKVAEARQLEAQSSALSDAKTKLQTWSDSLDQLRGELVVSDSLLRDGVPGDVEKRFKALQEQLPAASPLSRAETFKKYVETFAAEQQGPGSIIKIGQQIYGIEQEMGRESQKQAKQGQAGMAKAFGTLAAAMGELRKTYGKNRAEFIQQKLKPR